MYALVIAGGAGERLRPLTEECPKPMIPVVGRPILEHMITWLRGEGVTDAVLLCGYMAEVIQEHFGDGSRFGLRIHYSLEEEPLGRGGALRRGYSLVPSEEITILALNGDILTNQPLAPLIRYHQRKSAATTAMLTPLRSPYGIAQMDRRGHIVNFAEKPILPHWINAGVYALSPEFFTHLPVKGDHEDTAFPLLSDRGKLFGYRSRAYWRSIDSFKDLKEAELELPELTPPSS